MTLFPTPTAEDPGDLAQFAGLRRCRRRSAFRQAASATPRAPPPILVRRRAEDRHFWLLVLARCAADAGSHLEAARLLGAVAGTQERFGLPWLPRLLVVGPGGDRAALPRRPRRRRASTPPTPRASSSTSTPPSPTPSGPGASASAPRPAGTASPRPSCRWSTRWPPVDPTPRSPKRSSWAAPRSRPTSATSSPSSASPTGPSWPPKPPGAPLLTPPAPQHERAMGDFATAGGREVAQRCQSAAAR